MAKLAMPADAAKALSVKERVLLFCAASDTYWGHAGITGEIVTTMIFKGLIEHDTDGQIMPTERGGLVLRALLGEL
jgi:hypothetical protein